MTKMVFINLPVADLAASTRFYEAIGCKKNGQFSDDKASSMAWSDTIFFQLLTREYFSTFTSKQVADAQTTMEVLIALTRDSKDDVDSINEAAAKAGGKGDVREPMDMGFMYQRSFQDPDGHTLEAVWMNPSAM